MAANSQYKRAKEWGRVYPTNILRKSVNVHVAAELFSILYHLKGSHSIGVWLERFLWTHPAIRRGAKELGLESTFQREDRERNAKCPFRKSHANIKVVSVQFPHEIHEMVEINNHTSSWNEVPVGTVVKIVAKVVEITDEFQIRYYRIAGYPKLVPIGCVRRYWFPS